MCESNNTGTVRIRQIQKRFRKSSVWCQACLSCWCSPAVLFSFWWWCIVWSLCCACFLRTTASGGWVWEWLLWLWWWWCSCVITIIFGINQFCVIQSYLPIVLKLLHNLGKDLYYFVFCILKELQLISAIQLNCLRTICKSSISFLAAHHKIVH